MGLALPDTVRLAPSLLWGLEFYYLAFMQLTTCRVSGEIINPIPWTAINEYCRRYDLEGDEYDDLVYLMGEMDDAYLKWADKRKQRNQHNGKKQHGQP